MSVNIGFDNRKSCYLHTWLGLQKDGRELRYAATSNRWQYRRQAVDSDYRGCDFTGGSKLLELIHTTSGDNWARKRRDSEPPTPFLLW